MTLLRYFYLSQNIFVVIVSMTTRFLAMNTPMFSRYLRAIDALIYLMLSFHASELKTFWILERYDAIN
jgi:hypothetical protein